MNDVAKPVQQSPGSVGALCTALISGRVEAARSVKGKDGRFWLTLLKLPAADEFSSAMTIEVSSSEQLGDVGQVWRGRVKVGGYPRSYKATDATSGDVRTVRTAENKLTVLE